MRTNHEQWWDYNPEETCPYEEMTEEERREYDEKEEEEWWSWYREEYKQFFK